MANLQPGDMAAAGLLALNLRADGAARPAGAAAEITAPVQNLLVADRHDHRRCSSPAGCRSAAPATAAPRSTAPTARMTGSAGPPATSCRTIVAPASGRLVNANERVAPPDFPVFLGRDWFGDWRARRIRELLDAIRPPHRRPTSPACRPTWSAPSPASCCRACCAVHAAGPDARAAALGAAARLGRQR